MSGAYLLNVPQIFFAYQLKLNRLIGKRFYSRFEGLRLTFSFTWYFEKFIIKFRDDQNYLKLNFFFIQFDNEVKMDEDLENFITQKEYVALDKMKTDKTPKQNLLEEKMEKSIQPRKVELVDKDFLLKNRKREKKNFLYDTPGVFNDTQVTLLHYFYFS